MRVECAADDGKPGMDALLEEILSRALADRPVCDRKPCHPIWFGDRVLLRCDGCERAAALPFVAGIGFGADRAEAERNALYALTLPMDRQDIRVRGALCARRFGAGPARAEVRSCVFNRTACLSFSARDAEDTSVPNR